MSSQGRLQNVQNRFLMNITCLFELEKSKEDHEVMVPLTNTVYAAGQVVAKDKVTIDVGTGYFVEMVHLRFGGSLLTIYVGYSRCLMLLIITRERLNF